MHLDDLHKRLHTWRVKRRLTLQQVASLSGVSVGLLSQVANGHGDMRVAALHRVVTKAYGITMHRFWGSVPDIRDARPPVGRPRRKNPPRPVAA